MRPTTPAPPHRRRTPTLAPRRLRLAALTLSAAITLSVAERAEANDPVVAEALFQEGRRLVDGARYDEACPKLAESHRLDPGVGVLLYLADCYERAGKLASAWAAFHEAIPPTRKAGQREREEAARARASALEPRLPKLVLHAPEARPEGYAVRRGGVELSAAAYGVAVPIDPGKHVVIVTAPGHTPAELEVVAEEGKLSTLNLPALVPLPAAQEGPEAKVEAPAVTPPPASSAASDGGWSTQRTVALALAGGGLVGVGLGAGFGFKAMSDWSDAEARCTPGGPGVVCDAEGADLASSASTAGWVSTVGFAAGGTLLAASAVLFFTAESDAPSDEAAWRVVPLAGPSVAGVVFSGSF